MTQQGYLAALEWLRRLELRKQEAAAGESYATGGPVKPKPLPVQPVVAASSTSTVRPVSPFQIQADRAASIQQQVASNQPQLKPAQYVPQPVRQIRADAQARQELSDKALNLADKAAMTLPVPYLGETVGVIGAGVGAGIRGFRAIEDTKKGNYLDALNNAGNAVAPMAFPWLADKAKVAFNIAALGVKPTFTPSLAQAEADKGAEWSRNWFKGRANAYMGGLTPKDVAMSETIKRPLVPSVSQWKALGNGPNIHGSYYPRPNVATVSPVTPEPRSLAVHETTHQYQQAMRNTPAMKQGLGLIKEQMPPWPVKWNGPMTSYDRYWTRPDEVHARLMELRQKFGYKPEEYITKERVLKDIENHFDMNPMGTPNPGHQFDKGLWRAQIADWLNNTPGVALPVAVGASAAITTVKPEQ